MPFNECTESVTLIDGLNLPSAQAVLREVMMGSKIKSLKALFDELDVALPGVISSYPRLRQLGSGHRTLKPILLAQLAKFAIQKGWAGSCCFEAARYQPPSEAELKARRNARRYHRKVLRAIIEGRLLPSDEAQKAQRQATSAIAPTLEKLSAAGFNAGEILYMVAGWLSQNYGHTTRGMRQKKIVHYREAITGEEFLRNQRIDVENIPRNFCMRGHEESPFLVIDLSIHSLG